MKKFTGRQFFLRRLLRFLYLFLEILHKWRHVMVLMWLIALIILGALSHYVSRQIENQGHKSGRSCDTCSLWERVDRGGDLFPSRWGQRQPSQREGAGANAAWDKI